MLAERAALQRSVLSTAVAPDSDFGLYEHVRTWNNTLGARTEAVSATYQSCISEESRGVTILHAYRARLREIHILDLRS